MSDRVTELPDAIPPRRFEYADDKSYKFWTISLSGLRITTRYGRIGNPGQTHEVRFESPEVAKKDYARRVAQKIKAGYQERLAAKKKVLTPDDDWQALEDHEPFLQAILDDPDEMGGYAVYADWLTERQDPRGEFTLLQLALEDPSLALYKRPKVENSAKLLRQKHTRQWLGSLAPWLMDFGQSSYPYDFFRGQLSQVACYVLSLKFAHELRRSPHCRLLRELSIQSSEVLQEPMTIDGTRYEADRDYGLATLVGADFSNLREFRIGSLPDLYSMGNEVFVNATHAVELIESMPRLETLHLRSPVNLQQLFQLEMPNLKSLHLSLRPNQMGIISEANFLPRLNTFGVLSPLSESMVNSILKVPGFSELTEFSCSEFSRLPEKTMQRLRDTGVVINVLNYAGDSSET